MPSAINPLEHYIPVPEAGCWLWLGRQGNGGYGLYKGQRTHRLFYEAHVAGIPDGLLACHKCDTRLCVNPSHIFVGSYAENNKDMRTKRRHAHGEKQGHSKLTFDQVNEIREWLSSGATQRSLAEVFGVTQSQISHIATGRDWVELGEAA